MDELEQIKAEVDHWRKDYYVGVPVLSLKQIDWLIFEIETLRLDNTYLQQRLKREVEK